ncbi:acyltransferase domain-containing protein [Marinicella sediminis]|uniref:Acyltransferase domain-containing protein n=1 Tax=Marinicella sediminis TaxID=1792834 RepID=A0ABV7JAU7_9GAMM|nr:acyltransferase domain-containing protein [Marinicella sediminis]
MSKPIVFMFSGQGSQYFNMGRELYEQHVRFRSWMNHCDELAYHYLGTSLLNEILRPEKNLGDPFDRLLFTNPAILCVEFSLSKVLMEQGIKPDIMVGYSLGEMAALVVSGAIGLEAGLKFCIESAQTLETDGVKGGMLSVLETQTTLKAYEHLFQKCWLSGHNFAGNSVYSGTADDIADLQSQLKKKGIVTQRLPIHYAFHSPLMDRHQSDILKMAKSLSFSEPSVPVFSAVNSSLITDLNEQHMWQILAKEVEFSQTIEMLLQKGDHVFMDLGPSGTLATFVKYIMTEEHQSVAIDTMNQFGRNLHSLDQAVSRSLKSQTMQTTPA